MAGIKDLLDNILNPKPKATATGGVGKTTTTSGTAGTGKASGSVGAGSTWTAQAEAQAKAALVKQKELLAKKTHQDFINAAYKVADELKLKGGPWPLLRLAGWGHFTDDRGKLYSGPAIDEIEALTPEVKAALKKKLGV